MGRRHTGSSSPIRAIAAFTGIGFVSRKFTSISGKYLRWISRAPAKSPVSASRVSSVISSGISLETTRDDTVAAERDQRDRDYVVTGKHGEAGPEADGSQRAICADIARGFFYADDVVDFGQPLQRRGLDIHAAAALDVVKDDRELGPPRRSL